MKELEVLIESDVLLSGTLSVPEFSASNPAVLLIHGSGPVDRNENTKKIKLNVFSHIARALVNAGFVVLRYDKRGVGKSQGSFMKSGLSDFINDSKAALRFLRARSEVIPSQLFICGHSEGALIAAMISEEEDLKGAIFLAAPCTPFRKILAEQLSLVRVKDLSLVHRWFLKLLKYDDEKIQSKGKQQQEKLVEKALSSSNEVIRISMKSFSAKWLREHYKIDPDSVYRNVHCPVLVIIGSKDLQVPVEDAERIASLVRGEAEWEIVQDLTHILRRDHGPPSIHHYRELGLQPVDTYVLTLMKRWLQKHSTDH